MSLFSTKLDQLEARLQALIEGRLARLFPGREYRDRFVQHLLSAMKEGSQIKADGVTLAPDVYVLLVHPNVAPTIESHKDFLDELANTIQKMGSSVGLVFAQTPKVYVSSNTDVAENAMDVVARISQDGLSETVESTTQMEPGSGNIPKNAFLIVNGVKVVSLKGSVVNIGRRSGNDLVIDDPRVSRSHAQLRAANGKYVLFDLDSKGGTFINGGRVVQRTLVPKDVISLAGVPIVYGQDALSDTGLDQTQEMRLKPSPDAVWEEDSFQGGEER